MNERRLARLTKQIKQRLAEVLHREIADPKLGLVTITRVELDTEFTSCKAYWSVLSGSGQEQKAQRESAGVLNRARGFCQREMARVLHTRSVPQLEFIFDAGIGGAIRMQDLIRELNTPKDTDPGEGNDGQADRDTTPPAEDDPADDDSPQDDA